jgi:hypothetical protein
VAKDLVVMYQLFFLVEKLDHVFHPHLFILPRGQ